MFHVLYSIGLPSTTISPLDVHLVIGGADLSNALIGILVHQSFMGEGQSVRFLERRSFAIWCPASDFAAFPLVQPLPASVS